MIPHRNLVVQVIINVLILLGVLTSGVGAWVGMTYVFEPLPGPPVIQDVKLWVPTWGGPWGGPSAPAFLVEVDLDRIGRLRVEVTRKDGTTEVLEGRAVASEFRGVATDPARGSWYALAPGTLPAWVQRVIVRVYPVDWDVDAPLTDRRQTTKVLR